MRAKKTASRFGSRQINIIGFPMDLGQSRRGVDMGPSALRIAGIAEQLRALGHSVHDSGDIVIKAPETQSVVNPRLKYLPQIAESCTVLAKQVQQSLDKGELPLILGGDHSMSIGSVSGVAMHCRRRGKRLGVLWIDAHGDINTDKTSISGNIHGMPVGALMGFGAPELTDIGGFAPKVRPDNFVYIGLRSLDPGEVKLINKLREKQGLEAYAMPVIDMHGVYEIISAAIPRLCDRVDHLHVSFDLDSVDPTLAPGVGTPVPGGLRYREAHLIMELLAETGRVDSLEVAEVNPVLDDANRSAMLAVELLASCMGKRILDAVGTWEIAR